MSRPSPHRFKRLGRGMYATSRHTGGYLGRIHRTTRGDHPVYWYAYDCTGLLGALRYRGVATTRRAAACLLDRRRRQGRAK